MSDMLIRMETARRRAVAGRVADSFSIIRRSTWHARSPSALLEFDWDYDSIVVHYTGHQNLTDPTAIQDFDMDHQHRDDMAYHYAISPQGQIYEGRELIYKGSHTKLQNTGKIGIVCMGDYDTSVDSFVHGHGFFGDPVEDAMIGSLKRLSQTLRGLFPIHFFGGHIEYGDTATCPGSNLLPVVQAMRAELGLAVPIYRKF